MFLLKSAVSRFKRDGLNNLNMSIVNVSLFRLFTHVVVDVGEKPASTMLDKEEKNFLIDFLTNIVQENRNLKANELENLKKLLNALNINKLNK